MTTLARRTSQPSWRSAAPRARISVNSAVRRCATSRAPSSTTTAPRTARLTYSSPSTGATALSAVTNGARIAGTCELTVTVTGGIVVVQFVVGHVSSPEPRLVVPPLAITSPEESRPLIPACTALAWSAVSRPRSAGTTQVSSMRLSLRPDTASGSPPAPMSSAPAQCAGLVDVPAIIVGPATAGSSVQKSAAGWTGRMIPVIISRSVGPMLRRVPTRRPNLAAVTVVTAACTTAP